MVRAAGLYPVLTPDKRKVAGSSPASPTNIPNGLFTYFYFIEFLHRMAVCFLQGVSNTKGQNYHKKNVCT